MGKVRVLLIGAAFSADLHAEGYARCGDIAELVAICDKWEEGKPLDLNNHMGNILDMIFEMDKTK